MHLRTVSTYVLNVYLLLCCSTMSQGQDYRSPGLTIGTATTVRRTRDGSLGREPTCEELRAMWIFSKRQSRATEVTNDIPTYRDPFAYNVWDPFPRARSAGSPRVFAEHIYGRIVHNAPWRAAHDGSRRPFHHLGLMAPKHVPAPRRKLNYRLSGGGIPHLAPISGSFQQLKELIQNERARELQQQRTAEDAAARAAALQGLPVKSYYGHVVKDTSAQQDTADAYDKPQPSKPGVLTFPSLLLPSSSNLKDEQDYIPQGPAYKHRSYPEMIHNPFSVQSALFRQ